MAEKKGTFLSRLLKRLLIFVLVLVFLATGGYLFVRFYYGVDLITTFTHVSKLAKAVDDSAFTNTFTNEDKATLQTKINTALSADEYIKYSEEKGYYLDNDAIVHPLLSNLDLTDKECGALIDIFLNSQTEPSAIVLDANTKIPFSVIQVQFSNLDGAKVDFNVVVKLDLTGLKANKFAKFPLSLLKKLVPDYFYLSSTVTIENTGEGITQFNYIISNGRLAINGLSAKETSDLLSDFNRIFKSTSTASDIATKFATPVVNALIGKNTAEGAVDGFAKNICALDGGDYVFKTVADKIIFEVQPTV